MAIDGRIDVRVQCILGRQRDGGGTAAIEANDAAFGQSICKSGSVQLAALPVPTVAVVVRVSAAKGTGQMAGRGAAALAVVEARAGIAELADIAALPEVTVTGTVAAGSGAAGSAAGKSSPKWLTLAPSPRLNTETVKTSSKPKFFTRIPLLSHNMNVIPKCRRLQSSLLDGGADADSTPP
ncbi:MAG: hypothetical protein NVS9B2_10200 [Steroidobacteraceae bacterium]